MSFNSQKTNLNNAKLVSISFSVFITLILNLDTMDFVNDPISSHDYIEEEDPKMYKSKKTGRGPLNEKWIEEYTRSNKPIMCAYKLCRVEFRYWGMQTRVESWIHDRALRVFIVFILIF